jgi:hypothetical protein
VIKICKVRDDLIYENSSIWYYIQCILYTVYCLYCIYLEFRFEDKSSQSVTVCYGWTAYTIYFLDAHLLTLPLDYFGCLGEFSHYDLKLCYIGRIWSSYVTCLIRQCWWYRSCSKSYNRGRLINKNDFQLSIQLSVTAVWDFEIILYSPHMYMCTLLLSTCTNHDSNNEATQ